MKTKFNFLRMTRILLFSFTLLFLLPILFGKQARAVITCNTDPNPDGYWESIGGCDSKVCSGQTRNSGTECFMNDQGCDRRHEINENREESACWNSDQWGPCDLCGVSTSYGVQNFCGTCGGVSSFTNCNLNCWAPNGTMRCPYPPATKNGLSCYYQPSLGYSVCRNPNCPEKANCSCSSTPTLILTPTFTPTPTLTPKPTPTPTVGSSSVCQLKGGVCCKGDYGSCQTRLINPWSDATSGGCNPGKQYPGTWCCQKCL